MTDTQLIAIAAIVVGFLVFFAVPVIVAWARRSPDLPMIAKLAPLGLLSFAL